MKNLIFIMIVLMCSTVTYAQDYPTGWVTIQKIGCHVRENTCFVEISGNPVGPPECNSNSLRWNESLDANGKSILALLMSAYHSGKKVWFQVDGCYSYQPSFPTFRFINVG